MFPWNNYQESGKKRSTTASSGLLTPSDPSPLNCGTSTPYGSFDDLAVPLTDSDSDEEYDVISDDSIMDYYLNENGDGAPSAAAFEGIFDI
jgi:hypothetical protein